MSTELTVSRMPAGIVPLTLDDLERAIRLVGPNGALQLIVGQSAGLSIGQCLTDVHMVRVGGQVKPTLSATAQLALVRKAGARTEWIERTDEAAELEITPPGQKPTRWRVTLADAAKAGWSTGANKGTWAAHPGAMLRARCITRAIRAECPELLGGMSLYDPDELRSEPAEVVTATMTQPTQAAQPARTADVITVDATEPPKGLGALRAQLTERDLLGQAVVVYGDPGGWSDADCTSLRQWLAKGALPQGLAVRAVRRDQREREAVQTWGPLAGWTAEDAAEVMQWRADGYPALESEPPAGGGEE